MNNNNLDDIIKDNTPLLRSYVRSRVSNHDDADDIVQDTFYRLTRALSTMGIIYTLLYLVWLCALWFHLNHGIWSALQTVGMNNKKWFPRLKLFSTIYTTVIILMFAAVAVLFCLGYTCDINQVMH